MTKILGISGRKQSGKTTCFLSILGIEMTKLSIVRNRVEINEQGLFVSDIFGDEEHAGRFDPNRDNEHMKKFLDDCVYPYVKNYSFADELKRVCIEILGVPYQSLHGTDEEKRQPTHLKWEDMPGVVTDKGLMDMMATREVRGRLGKYYDKVIGGHMVYHAPGYMTGRQVMQYVGTELFRRMYNKCWAENCIRRIEKEGSLFAIVDDVRFPDELQAIKDAGGKVIRLTKNMKDNDAHDSERVLDPDVYDWNNFDAVIDNANMTIGEQNCVMLGLLAEWEYIDKIGENNE